MSFTGYARLYCYTTYLASHTLYYCYSSILSFSLPSFIVTHKNSIDIIKTNPITPIVYKLMGIFICHNFFMWIHYTSHLPSGILPYVLCLLPCIDCNVLGIAICCHYSLLTLSWLLLSCHIDHIYP